MSLDQQLARFFWDTPPVTRVLLFSSVTLGLAYTVKLISPYYLVYIGEKVFTYREIPQLWRLFTAFVLPGSGLSLIFDPYIMYNYSKPLEMSTRFAQPGDYCFFVLFVCSVILVIGGHILGTVAFMSPLTMAFAYIFSVDQPEAVVNFFVFSLKAKYLPWAMLGIALLMGGKIFNEAVGLIAAHLYNFLTHLWPLYGGGSNYLTTPVVLRRWFAAHTRPVTSSTFAVRPVNATPGAGAAAGGPVPSSSTSGFSSMFGSSGAWGSRGTGHRLGGD